MKGVMKMKQITIGTKRQADAVRVASLFSPVNGKTLNDAKFDRGKYTTKPDVPYVGRIVEVADCIHAVYPVSRTDADGPYIALRCIME
jgi:hypothetical protein